MHYLIIILGSVTPILILLLRLREAGVDFGWLNPFLWNRRRKWRQKIDRDPIFAIDSPMDVTALLMVTVAKCDGDMSAEQKKLILDLFEEEFHLSRREASALLNSSVFLLKDGATVRSNPGKVLAPVREQFTHEQADSARSLIARVGSCEGKPSEMQAELIQKIWAALPKPVLQEAKWN